MKRFKMHQDFQRGGDANCVASLRHIDDARIALRHFVLKSPRLRELQGWKIQCPLPHQKLRRISFITIILNILSHLHEYYPLCVFQSYLAIDVRRYGGIGRIVAFDSQVPKMEGYFQIINKVKKRFDGHLRRCKR